MTDQQWIASDPDWNSFASKIGDAPRIAVDTEFIRRDTYRAKLGLLQLGVDPHVALVDTIAPLNLAPIAAVLCQAELVLHSASEDLEVFRDSMGFTPTLLFDTQIAAGFLTTEPPPSLAKLLERELGVVLDKTQSRSDWLKRPLSAAQCEYAAEDVAHLLRLRELLHRQLAERGFVEAAAEECARLIARGLATDTQPQRRYRLLWQLSVAQQRVLRRLLLQREIIAIDRNRPRGWIVDNGLAYALAESQPKTPEQARALADQRKLRCPRELEPWLALAHADTHELDAGFVPTEKLSASDDAKINRWRSHVATTATKLGIAAELLASRKLLEAIARGDVSDELNGWRAAHLGPILQDLNA